jgi:hypothetical protein
MKDFDYAVALRIRHPFIDPGELTEKLGFAPQHSWQAGQRKPEAAGEPGDGTYRETYWLGRVPSPALESIPDLPLEGALMFVLLQIRRSEQFWSRLLADGASARLIVQIFGRDDFTLELSQSTLAMLVRLRVAISVDVHTEMRAVA